MSEANRTEEVSRLSTYFLISEQVRRQPLTGVQLQAMPEYVEMEHSTLDILKTINKFIDENVVKKKFGRS